MKKATISGEIAEVKQTDKGTRYWALLVDFDSFQGEKWVERWTVWLPQSGFEDIEIKDWVELEGIPGASAYQGKDKDGNDKLKVSMNLNSPNLIQVVKHSAAAFPGDTQDEDDRRKYGTGLAPF